MLNLLPADALPLGIGCARLGSVGGLSQTEAQNLLRTALDEGVRFFDTAGIYGQGDSERFLADALAGRDDCVVVSKAGKYVAWQRQLLVPIKAVLRVSVRRSSSVRQRVSSARAKPMPTRWDASFLNRSLEGSLRRLHRERIDIFLLHSPTAEVVRSGDAISVLERARSAGKIGVVGVSVDDVHTATACLADERIRVLEIPLHPHAVEYAEVLDRAEQEGVAVIAREVLGGPATMAQHVDGARFARSRIAAAINDPRISLPIVGVTRIETLLSSADAARSAHSQQGEPPAADGEVSG